MTTTTDGPRRVSIAGLAASVLVAAVTLAHDRPERRSPVGPVARADTSILIDLGSSPVPGWSEVPQDTSSQGINAAEPAPMVTISVAPPTRDPATRVWTYTYTIHVQAISSMAAGDLILRGLARYCNVASPTGWSVVKNWKGTSGIQWYATATDQDTAGLSPYRVRPGTSIAAFTLRSYAPPGTVRFVCEGAIDEGGYLSYPDDSVAALAFGARGGYSGSLCHNAATGSVGGPVGTVSSCPDPTGGDDGGDEPRIIRGGPLAPPRLARWLPE